MERNLWHGSNYQTADLHDGFWFDSLKRGSWSKLRRFLFIVSELGASNAPPDKNLQVCYVLFGKNATKVCVTKGHDEFKPWRVWTVTEGRDEYEQWPLPRIVGLNTFYGRDTKHTRSAACGSYHPRENEVQQYHGIQGKAPFVRRSASAHEVQSTCEDTIR